MKSLLLLFALAGSSAFALIAPPYVVQNEFQGSIGLNPCFVVKSMQEPVPPAVNFKMVIQACDLASGQALADVLTPSFPDYGVEAQVVDPSGKAILPNSKATDAQVLADLTKVLAPVTAFSRAYGFCGLGTNCTNLVVEFKPTVIKIFTDDIGVPDSNRAFLAADLFGQFLTAGPAIVLRTYTGN